MCSERRPYNLDLPDSFWSMIDQLRANPRSAREIIGSMAEQQMRLFYFTYREATEELCEYGYDEDKWEHEDDYHDACCWVVNKGKDVYLAAWNDPSLIPTTRPPDSGDWSGLVSTISREQFGRELCG